MADVDTTTAPEEPTVVLDDALQQNEAEGTSASEVESDVEREARSAGWVPQEEWKGAPERWRDAATYVDARNHILPVVQKENKSLRDKNAALEARLARLEQVEQERAAQREQLSVETLRVERQQAIENGDYARVNEIDGKLMETAAKEAVNKVAPKQQEVDPRVTEIWEGFVADNDWVKQPKAQKILYEQLYIMKQTGSPEMGREALDEAKDRVRRMYPEFFPKARSMAEGGGFNGAPRSNTRSWNDLKPEVKDALEKMIEDTPGLTKEGVLKRAAANPAQYFRR
jgi:hypothetical protein